MVLIRCSDPRAMAGLLLGEDYVLKLHFGADGRSVLVETNNRDRFFGLLLSLIVKSRMDIDEITSPDDNLQAVFDYLVGK
jgi:ABC-2 type transport system ATP-binding protein